MTPYRKTILIDFDGVLNSYVSGWKGPHETPDPPNEGAIEWLSTLLDDARFDVCVYSSRSREPGGPDAMIAWLRQHGLTVERTTKLRFPTEKEAAFLTIDDRAVQFRGHFPPPDFIANFKPWKAGEPRPAIGEYPNGKLNDDDEGGIEFAIGIESDAVIIRFGGPVAWFGLHAEQARAFAAMLLKHAITLEQRAEHMAIALAREDVRD